MKDHDLGTKVRVVDNYIDGYIAIGSIGKVKHILPRGKIQALYLVEMDNGDEWSFWHDELEEVK